MSNLLHKKLESRIFTKQIGLSDFKQVCLEIVGIIEERNNNKTH